MFLPLPPSLSLHCTLLLLHLPTPIHAYKPLSPSFLLAIPSPNPSLNPINGTLLTPLLIPRVPGTPGHTSAQHHFVNFFESTLPHWSIAWQNSTAHTPASNDTHVPISNLIFKREPPWVKPGQANLLTLVAHYDSMRLLEGNVGATDSAAACAVLMYIAGVVDGYVQRMYDEMQALGEGGDVDMDMGIQILLLDGSEQGMYGSKALATNWSTTPNPPSPSKFYSHHTPLSQISLFLPLSLLGAPNPHVPSYFPTTHWAYRRLATIESRMRALHLLESDPPAPFLPDMGGPTGTLVSDDYVPFMEGGVEVLHVCPDLFPDVWRGRGDEGGQLDGGTVGDWARIVLVFALEWLDMMEVWDGPE